MLLRCAYCVTNNLFILFCCDKFFARVEFRSYVSLVAFCYLFYARFDELGLLVALHFNKRVARVLLPTVW